MAAPSICDYDTNEVGMQKYYETPMPWIGMYVAAASLVCAVAMAGDVIHGLRGKKLWFPCKFFTMNAASITVLAVAMKLPVDFTSVMWGNTDTMAKISSTIFMTTVMGNFLTSFALMDDNAILMNIVALGVLVITIIVDMCIQLYYRGIYGMRYPHIYVLVSMFVLFVTLSSSGLMVPTTKRYLDSKYNELHKTVCDEGNLEKIGKLTNQKLKDVVEKYWVMAETGSPQFVMARSVTSSTSGAICLFTAILLVRAEVKINKKQPGVTYGESNSSSYQWSTSWILWIQFVGVAIGTVAPVCRWFTAICFNCRNLITEDHRKEFKLVESYWIQTLVEWKERPLALPIHNMKCKKIIQGMKILVLNLCIGVQFGIVATCKSVQLISIIFILPFFSCFYYYKRLKSGHISASVGSVDHESSEPKDSSPKLNLSDYVLLLEGEAKLPKSILTNMCDELNQAIQLGKIHRPKNLTKLLQISNDSFKGVLDFDSTIQVLDCWILPVVTLTSIAVALPTIENHKVDQLISSVSEGLSYANLVESISSKGENSLNIKHAADVVWVGIELYRKWLDTDFRKLSVKGKTTQEILQTLVDIAEKTAIKFQRSINGSSKVLVANSMYRVSHTILKNHYENNSDDHIAENLFEELSVMIADILGACLINLPRVISLKCYCNTVEKREKGVRHAARLLGETEEILEILRHRQLPSISSDRAVYINEWRAFMKQNNPPPVVGSSNNVVAASVSGELHLAVDE
ncbi:hypothetical protein Vadar_014331 [Vaccinium darrowii]|uniref:Uncharacterized protein n=1 Tax=Vaccinium darrowii TaxID=229202 RepID=A0ACB7XQZ2_9ERIC|nr:hypothetical protein Vadar_014331 [Vaccinium darrowii]